ncbi:unnamed protein product [Withania somnifera]
MAVEEDIDLSDLKYQLRQTHVNALRAKLLDVKACTQGSEEETKKEVNVLWRRVRTAATLMTYLKEKARVMAVPDSALTSCGIKELCGVGHIDKNGVPLSSWSRDIDLSIQDSFDEQDGSCTSELLRSVQMVTDVMENLVKGVIMAESETALEKQMVTIGQGEVQRRTLQIENMSTKLEDMERFASGTNCILNEMRQRVEDLVKETSRQRQRAAENEQELCCVKRDFESLKSHVSSLISVRETLLSSEKQFQTIERLFECSEAQSLCQNIHKLVPLYQRRMLRKS